MLKYMKIARREAHETEYWLSLLYIDTQDHKELIDRRIQESIELRNILSSIIKKIA